MDATEKMSNKKQKYAVLTGDMVGSSTWPAEVFKQVMQQLRVAVPRFERVFPGSVMGAVDVFSGDGWQLLMSDWKKSLRAALYVRAVIRSYDNDLGQKLDTRIALAWGELDETALNLVRISESTGEVFTASGRALAAMKKQERLIVAPVHGANEFPFLPVAVSLVDEWSTHWTPRQAETLVLVLLNFSQEEIARTLGKRQPTVNRALQRVGWRGIEKLLDTVEHSS